MKLRHLWMLVLLSLVIAPAAFAAVPSTAPAESSDALEAVVPVAVDDESEMTCTGDVSIAIAAVTGDAIAAMVPGAETHCDPDDIHVSSCTQCPGGCWCQPIQLCCVCQ